MAKLVRRPTLLELLVLLAFVGILIEIAIPPTPVRRVPAKSDIPKGNLRAIRAAEVAYFAEWGFYVGNQPPASAAKSLGNLDEAGWGRNTRFSILGFAPEGDIFCGYSLEGTGWPSESEGFTARAECDFDDDGELAVFRITNNSTEIVHSGDDF